MHTRPILVIALFVASGATTASAVNIISFDFTATVTGVTDLGGLLGGEISVGQTLTGSFQYDLDVADSDPIDTSAGLYDFGPFPSSQLLASNGVFSTSVNDGFFVFVGDSAIFGDIFDIEGSSISISPLTSLPIPFFESEILLQDSSGTAFTSDALPTAFNVSDFEDAFYKISNVDSGSEPTVVIISTITFITPEPSAIFLALFALGLLGMGYYVRHRR